MKASKVYRKAAELVITGHKEFAVCGFSCIAIEVAVAVEIYNGNYGADSSFTKKYSDLFRPDEYEDSRFSVWGNQWGDTEQESQDCRVLALLFMSEIAKGEEE